MSHTLTIHSSINTWSITPWPSVLPPMTVVKLEIKSQAPILPKFLTHPNMYTRHKLNASVIVKRGT